MLVGDSTTTEGVNTESLERQEFANRLAQQNSALHSLGCLPDSPGGNNRFGQTGTLEGLEELKEVVEEIRKSESEKSKSTEKSIDSEKSESSDFEIQNSEKAENESSNTGSIFSDATESTEKNENLSVSPSIENDSIESDTLKEDSELTNSEKKSENGGMEMDSLQPVTVQNVDESITEATEIGEAAGTQGIGVDFLEPYVEAKSDSEAISQNQSQLEKEDEEKSLSIDDLLGLQPQKDESIFETPKSASVSENEENDAFEIVKSESTRKLQASEEPQKTEATKAIDDLDEKSQSLRSLSVSIADIPPEDFGKTHEISLADSSLAELLNLTQEASNQKKLAHTFEPQKKPQKVEKIEKRIDTKEGSKTSSHKKPDFSHVKSSGYGNATYKPSSSQRPRISPRLAAKVEAAKVEKRKKSQLRLSQSQGFASSLQNDKSEVESLREQLEQEKKREQGWVLFLTNFFIQRFLYLSQTKTVELSNYYLAEQEHLQRVQRANEFSQKLYFPSDNGDQQQQEINKENEKLLSSYQLENEKLYLRNKELELKITELRTSTTHGLSQENDTIDRLENLLKKEETLRRNTEVAAREANRQRDEERRKVAQLEDELRISRNSVESESLVARRLREQLNSKEKEVTDLMKQLSVTSSSANNVSEKIEQLSMTKNDEIKKLTIELGKCKAELDFLSKNQNKSKSKMNSFACQFDNDSSSSASSILDEKKIRQLKDEAGTLKREKRDLYSQLHELREKAGRLDIAVESHEFEMEKLTQENARIRLIAERVPLLESKLARAEENCQNSVELENRLQASIEDRNVFEERYLKSVESVKQAQAEIDARQQLVVDMHKQCQNFQRAANNILKERTAAQVELENMRIELELVRQNSLPENLSHFAKKLSEMEAANAQKEVRLRKIMQGEDSPLMRKEAMVDQTDTIINLKTTLNAKNNQFNK
ncbi:Oidioi.mRNA.OKI2018_I69.chr1.g589.t1.cds [Oikopleura dioica]|uniref:Oidioi.mRNA.OKI2018_I69.chr1.g589.t1.cds n=1 Tax=Oikopleura dioica TaxID=34765 RepID=A0ABN7SP00_OIKDI|nr:Oidioi.mRNA.OKI2018_I69.chr1.g589.t1.cds [Oikopleura dioica]